MHVAGWAELRTAAAGVDPGLERLRDRAALRVLDRVLIAAPDRLARHYVHQALLLEEIAATGCEVEFLDRPMSRDPHDQLLLQIRGAVAEYERTVSESMEALAAVLVPALERDLLGADDFAPPPRERRVR